ncbi:SurA N-terminal domain-containing protein [Seohaeicola saemankumensis]|nr:peptidyl-prolyl cis-trans isomerase [Seohaeicola saemankumensis]MCA0871287.1 SurA N-terminal domain-containing protein [Seohaeicola saemankumensis]
MAAGVKSLSKTFVWILMGLLMVGLAGFGATSLTGTVRTVATVGDEVITVDAYAREMQREIRAIEAQTGQAMQMSQAVAMGLDRSVLARLVALASLDNEVAQAGISIGDENLQKEIVAIPAFQGIDGQFDRESYRFALEQAGLSEVEFEEDLRNEAARTLVQGSVIAGVVMPQTMTEALTDFIAARRSFTVATLTAASLDEPLPEPTEEQLKAHYEANGDRYTLPETKQLTYALLVPEMMLDQVEVDEDSIRRLYEERSGEFNLPERRLVERLVFSDDSAASDAMAQVEVGGATFESLVQARGLDLSDTDLGDVTLADLEGAGEAVFAADVGDVVGPLPSSLGPALFRVNGVLAARETAFEDARADLRDELAGERARRLIETQAENIDDLLAGGATLEELTGETDMELGRIDWTANSVDDIAAYDAFRDAAAAVTAEDFPEVTFLEDGGIFAMRLDDVLPPRPEAFDDARDRVVTDWTVDQTEAALRDQAQAAIATLATSGDFVETGLNFRVENGLTRTAYLDGTPADFMTEVFDMEPGELRIISGDGAVFLVRLDETLPPEDTPELAQMRAAFGEELNQSLAQGIFDAYVRDAQLRARPMVDQQALNAVQASFQ